MERPISLLIRDRKQGVLVAVVLIKTVTDVRLNSTVGTSDFVVQHCELEVFNLCFYFHTNYKCLLTLANLELWELFMFFVGIKCLCHTVGAFCCIIM